MILSIEESKSLHWINIHAIYLGLHAQKSRNKSCTKMNSAKCQNVQLTLLLCQVGDLVGTSLLAVAFIVLEQVGDLSLENLEVGHHGHGLENSTLAANLTTTLHTVLTNDLH